MTLFTRAALLCTQARAGLAGRRYGPLLKAGVCLASILAGVIVLASVYGPDRILDAAGSADPWYLFDALCAGTLIQIVRAQRARLLLAQDRPVSFSHSYTAMVVGHGVGDLVPMAPGGPVLRSVLTERLAGVPVGFSGGAFVLEGALDVIAPALLVPYVIIALPLPAWAQWVLIGVTIQAGVLLLGLLTLGLRRAEPSGKFLPASLAPRLLGPARQAVAGMRALASAGPKRCLQVTALSVLLLGLTAGQMILFLHAFALGPSAGGLLLLLVVALSSGSLPLKVPGSGTISTAAALPLAGIHGPVVGGYLLVSQCLMSCQTPLLAALVLGWWSLRGARPDGAIPALGRRAGRWLSGSSRRALAMSPPTFEAAALPIPYQGPAMVD